MASRVFVKGCNATALEDEEELIGIEEPDFDADDERLWQAIDQRARQAAAERLISKDGPKGKDQQNVPVEVERREIDAKEGAMTSRAEQVTQTSFSVETIPSAFLRGEEGDWYVTPAPVRWISQIELKDYYDLTYSIRELEGRRQKLGAELSNRHSRGAAVESGIFAPARSGR